MPIGVLLLLLLSLNVPLLAVLLPPLEQIDRLFPFHWRWFWIHQLCMVASIDSFS